MVNKKTLDDFSFSVLVGIPGLEPGKAGPESAVLPLHHIPICVSKPRKFLVSCLRVQRYNIFLYPARKSRKIFKKSHVSSLLRENLKKNAIFGSFEGECQEY